MQSLNHYVALFFVLLPTSALIAVLGSVAWAACKGWLNRRGAWRITRRLKLKPRRHP